MCHLLLLIIRRSGARRTLCFVAVRLGEEWTGWLVIVVQTQVMEFREKLFIDFKPKAHDIRNRVRIKARERRIILIDFYAFTFMFREYTAVLFARRMAGFTHSPTYVRCDKVRAECDRE